MTIPLFSEPRFGPSGLVNALKESHRYTSWGSGQEAQRLERGLIDAIEHTLETISQATIEQKFNDLVLTWKIDTRFSSSLDERVTHPSYQRIIGLGPQAIPLLLSELAHRPNHWFWALESLTGTNPVDPEHAGVMSLMVDDWMEWGIQNGYIPAT